MSKQPVILHTKSEEKKILDAQSEAIRKNPQIGIDIAIAAGIIDENGKLTAFYQQK